MITEVFDRVGAYVHEVLGALDGRRARWSPYWRTPPSPTGSPPGTRTPSSSRRATPRRSA
ncbi:hypothetical protein NKH77_10750 [Streptomyces sp. M19]